MTRFGRVRNSSRDFLNPPPRGRMVSVCPPRKCPTKGKESLPLHPVPFSLEKRFSVTTRLLHKFRPESWVRRPSTACPWEPRPPCPHKMRDRTLPGGPLSGALFPAASWWFGHRLKFFSSLLPAVSFAKSTLPSSAWT